MGPSVDQCQMWALQFLMHVTDLLSILLRVNGFTGIQKAVVDQTSSRPPNSDHDFFGAILALGSALEFFLGPATELVIAGCCIQSTFHRMSQSDQGMVHCCCIEKEDTSKRFFLICGPLMRHPLIKLFHLSSSVQSLSLVQLFATLWTTACQDSLSITNSQSLLKLMSIESVMPSNYLILCHPLLFLPSILPSISVFSNE